ncbi:MAG: hypothetical protein AAF667_09970 [Pseudomonadota bacterium]
MGSIREAIRLITIWGGAASKGDALSILGAGAKTYDSLSALWGQTPPSLQSLAEDLETAAQDILAAYPDTPPDAEVHYAQMLEIGLPDPQSMAALNLDGARMAQDMLERIRNASHAEAAHTRDAMPDLFLKITAPLLDGLVTHRSVFDELKPHAIRRLLDITEETYRELKEKYGTLAKSLEDLRSLRRRDLEFIAAKFRLDVQSGATEDSLIREIGAVADDYLARRKSDVRTSERNPQIADLKAQARAARDDLDFVMADQFLAKATVVEEEIVAETQKRVKAAQETALAAIQDLAQTYEERGDNALDANRADEAFRHFSAAADCFVSFDQVEPARRRSRYQNNLWEHALRYGGPGFALMEEMVRAALSSFSPEMEPRLYGWLNINLGNALQRRGANVGGPEGARLFDEAVHHFRLAANWFPQSDHPADWAMMQMNLGNAFGVEGLRTAGPKGAALFSEAINAYQAALTFFSEADHPADWAKTQVNLANVLQTQGSRTAGPEGAALLSEAVAAYRAALTVFTEADHPVDWAGAQMNLGSAVNYLGVRTSGPTGTALLSEAITAYRAALTVYTKADHRLNWAAIQMNLGAAFNYKGARTAGPKGAALLSEALEAYDAALTVRTEAEYPMEWARTLDNLAAAEEAIADHDTTTNPRQYLQAALTHVTAALTVFDYEYTSFNHDRATRLRDRIQARLDALE